MEAQVFEYSPTYVKLPNGIRKVFPNNNIWKQQIENQTMAPLYDDYSLFYDVFFDLNKNNIWAVGPPLFTFKEKMFPLKILYKGKPIRFQYHQYQSEKIGGCANCLQIPATNIKEKKTTLTFLGSNWEIDIKVASFPITKAKNPTMAFLQKNYSSNHIVDWILWHYRIHNFRRILFYDNGSDNIQEVKAKLKNIPAPNLEIIFVHWPYYYGNPFTKNFTDLFAQRAQLNHSLKLHYRQNCYIANWDIDEYLITTDFKKLPILKHKKPFFLLKRYDIVDTKEKKPTNIKDCLVRKKNPGASKYFFHTKKITFLHDVHHVDRDHPQYILLFRIISFLFRIISFLFAKKIKIKQTLRKRITTKYHISPMNLYLIHANPIKKIWKRRHIHKGMRPFQVIFDSKYHIEDDNIKKNIEKSKL